LAAVLLVAGRAGIFHSLSLIGRPNLFIFDQLPLVVGRPPRRAIPLFPQGQHDVLTPEKAKDWI
jgi:hypothetical protein